MATTVDRLSICQSCLLRIADPNVPDNKKIEAAEQISEELLFIAEVGQQANCQLLDDLVTKFLDHLENTEPQFISEIYSQRLRKIILEMIQRLPSSDIIRTHINRMIKVMFKLFEDDNEENVGIVLRIIIQLQNTYKPKFLDEILSFLDIVKNLYGDIRNVYDVNTMFEEKRIVVKELTKPKIEELLSKIHTATSIEVEQPTSPLPIPPTAITPATSQQPSSAANQTSTNAQANAGTPGSIGEPTTPGNLNSANDTCSSSSSQQSSAVASIKPNGIYTLLPKANRSIRVIAELPIIVVLLSKMHEVQLQKPLEQLLPIVLETTLLRPPDNVRLALKAGDRYDKEIYVEFISAQIKCLSFVAYLVDSCRDIVTKNSQQLVKGLMNLLNDCPHEVVAVRKELIAASKYIFQSPFKDKFVEHLHVLCNDDVLVRTGYTVYETLRPQAYHLIFDLLNNYDGRIQHNDLAVTVNLFAKNLHDNTLAPHVRLMSCKAFEKLVGFAVKPLQDANPPDPREVAVTRDLLMKMIEIFVLKFKNIAIFQLSSIRARLRAQQAQQQVMMQQLNAASAPPNAALQGLRPPPQQVPGISNPANVPTPCADAAHREVQRPRFDFAITSANQIYSISECREAIRSLIVGVKTAIEAIPSHRADQIQTQNHVKLFHPRETIVIARLLKYGLKALDILYVASPAPPMTPMTQMNRQKLDRTKEDKESMEAFASVFTKLHPLMFQEVFSKMINFIVDRTRQNGNLMVFINYIISAAEISPIFSTILLEYLIERMHEIGSNDELSSLHLRMFKMVFASVTLYPSENEKMLKPLLHTIVSKSIELALSAKEPYNYFLLLRALFRSIGGGSHDMLYSEFLPLLPNLLQSLNKFQSGQHKQIMKDLFTELCLTVPVRLSSLMPYMRTLIYPLVSALNGPNQLVGQGLRTLELCVDSLDPDYLYDLLQPVRAELMQGLWKTVRNPQEQIAQTCLRVLGKFGGNNRRMLIEPQKLTYNEQKEGSSAHGTTIVVHFPDQKVSINLPIDRAVHVACESLKQANTNTFYKHHSWELIKSLLIASITNGPDHSQKIKTFFSNPNLANAHIPIRKENIYKCTDEVSREVYKTALIGMMVSSTVRELKNSVVPFMNAIVRHHVMLSIGQHLSHHSIDQYQGMDPYCLIDALSVIIGHDDKDLSKSGYYVMVLMIDTATLLLGSKERACELPLINYLVKSMYELCYARAWYTKMGGCCSIRYFTDNMPLGWLFRYLIRFVRALLYIMSDLTGELSIGVVDMAQTNLDRLLNVCGKPITDENALAEAQKVALNDVTDLLIKEITSQNLSVRTHAMKSIELMAKLTGKSAAQIMEPHRDILKTMLPFLEAQQGGDRPMHALEKQPVRSQIGIIHGSTFCTNLEPQVFTIDTSIGEHRFYVDQLIRICENDDSTLKKLQCYADVTNLTPVRTAALQSLASLHYLKDYQNTIFKILFNSTESNSPELQAEAYSCIVKFTSKITIDTAVIQEEITPMLTRLKDSSKWNLQSVKRLICIANLFPSIFEESFSLELQQHLDNISTYAINDLRGPLDETQNEKLYHRSGKANERVKICAAIIDLLVLMNHSPMFMKQTIHKLMSLVFKVEVSLMMETGSPLRAPLKALLRKVPEQTISVLLSERNLQEQQVYRMLKYMLKGDDGQVFRNIINQPTAYKKLHLFTSGVVKFTSTEPDENGQAVTRSNHADLRYQSILIVSIMIKYDHDWLISRRGLVDNLQMIWMSEEFHTKHNRIESTDYTHWKEPKLLVQCLLNYFQNQTAAGNKEVIELLFQLLRVFMNRYLCDFEFFRLFLEKTVIETYSIEWKRDAFAKFANIFHDPNYSQKLKAKILQYIIIPSFAHSFEKGLGEALLGGPPQPDRDNPNNLIHMFINKVIDPICSSDRKFIISDAVRILLLQFSCLLVDQASAHIHEASNRRQSSRLKKFVSLAWPCLMNKTSVDPVAKYHGHFLLSHIIAKFAVHKKIIIQVFHGLLKASTPDARVVVKQALDILLPSIPNRLEEGNSLLLRWTKKILIEEGHTPNQLIHMLSLLVRHYRLYYPMRNHLVPLMISSMQKLGHTPSGTIENRRTAVDLCEVIMRWEMYRQREFRERQRAQLQLEREQQHQMQQQQQPQEESQPAPAGEASSQQVVSETGNQEATSNQKEVEQQGGKPGAGDGVTPMQVDPAPEKPAGVPTETTTPAVTTEVTLDSERQKAGEAHEDIKPTVVDGKVVETEAPETGSTTIESTQLAKSESNQDQTDPASKAPASSADSSRRPTVEPSQKSEQQAKSEGSTSAKKKHIAEDPLEPLDPKHVDAILNALTFLACYLNPGHAESPPPAYTTYKNLSDRCINLIKKILMPEVWGGSPIVGPNGPNLNFSSWMADLLCSIHESKDKKPNFGGICGALELLTFFCGLIKQEDMLASLVRQHGPHGQFSITKGIIACTRSSNSRIIRAVRDLIQRIMFVFPPTTSKPNTTNTAPHEELEVLYDNIEGVITKGLEVYDQWTMRPDNRPATDALQVRELQVRLFSSLMVLKATCHNNPTYIDRVMPTLIRVIKKMTLDHINTQPSSAMSIELLILGIDLVKDRLGTMNPDLRKQFIQQILSNLIEAPNSDVKVLKNVVRIVEEWMKQKQPPSGQGGPNLREKTLLLIKLMLFIEKRFPTEPELMSQFLELIYHVYRDDELKTTDLTTKLECAFMAGLRCVQPQIRSKFFALYDQNVKPKLYERLMYIVCAQNWYHIGCHFWIQQCIEFILAIAYSEMPISTMDTSGCLPCIPTTADLGSYNPNDYESTSSHLLSMLSNDANTVVPPPEDIEFVPVHDQFDNLRGFLRSPKTLEEVSTRKNLQIMVNRQVNFLEDLKKTRTGDSLRSLIQLCHMSVDLAKTTWINMFPRIWRVLNDQQMTLLGREIIPFLCSGAHSYQRDCNPSAVGAFMEAVSRCQPSIHMRPILIKYLGKNHNIWHRAALMLEDSLRDRSLETTYPIPARSNKANQQNQKDFDLITLNSKFTLTEEAVESVSDILELLREDDMWSGLWQKKAQYEETKNAVLCEQFGLFQQAQEHYESAMNRQRLEFDSTYILRPGMKSENRLWEKHWIRCTKELNQWDSLLEYGSSKACTNPMLVLESAWRVPNWQMMKNALILVEENCPASLMWRLHLYKGYNYICNHPELLHMVDESFHVATSYCIQTWKKLPHIITNAHIPLLQAAQQLLELIEAKSLHESLLGNNLRNTTLELRTILKAWPKRVPILLDDLSHWSDILTWRQHQYQTIVTHFENQANQLALGHARPMCMPEGPASVAMQGSHFSAQGIISFGTVARKQGLLNVCLENINRIHTIPSVPIYDCYQKIRQQIKCYLKMPATQDKSELLDGLDIIECTNVKYFQCDYRSEFYTYKGIFLSRLGRYEDADKAFSAAAQLADNMPKNWSAWGEHMETVFTQDFTQTYEGFTINPNNFANRQISYGVSAISCYLQACKYYPESKARKYIAKVLWLLSFDNSRGELVDTIGNFFGPTRESGVPASNWIVWIPQILQCLMMNPDADALRYLLINIGKLSPQAVYFPVRTLLLTLKVILSNSQRRNMQAGASGQIAVTPNSNTASTASPSVSQTPRTPHTPSAVGAEPSSSDPSASIPPPPSLTPVPPTLVPNSPAPTSSPAPSMPMSSQPMSAMQQPSTPRPVASPQSFTSGMAPSPHHQSTASPSASSTQQPTLIQQLQQPPALLTSQTRAMPSPGASSIHQQSPQGKAFVMRTKTLTRCAEIQRRLGEAHPTTISSLEGITDQMVWLSDYSYEEIQRQIQQALSKCYASAFENAHKNLAEQTVSPQTLNFIRRIVVSFGVSLQGAAQGAGQRCGYHAMTVDCLTLRNKAINQDPEFQKTRVKFRADFEESLLPSMKLIALIGKLKSWVTILSQKKKLMPKTYLLEDKCRFLSNFSQHTADVEMPGEALVPKNYQVTPGDALMPKSYHVRIARFIPEVQVIEKHNTSARRILIRGHNGKIYPYLVLNESCLSDSRREERVLQLLRLLNNYLINRKETGRRYLQFTVPRVVGISPGLRLVEDNQSSLALLDILKRRINHNKLASASELDQDSPITEYYDRLMKLQAQNMPVGHKNIKDIVADIQNKMVPKTLLKDWAAQAYVNATDYWVFRSQFTYQLAMACLSEYAFHLTRMMPESIYVHQDSGQISVTSFKFDLNDSNAELKGNRPVPFRLTPNIVELITQIGIAGPFRGALDSVASSLTTPQNRVISILRAILRDEMLFWQQRGQDSIESEVLVTMVNKAVNMIYQRLNAIASNENPLDSQSPQLISQATSLEQLSQMDPAWHPWL